MPDYIVTARELFGVSDATQMHAFLAERAAKKGIRPESLSVAATLATPALAYVNHGRWVADCPERDGGALALYDGQVAFLCPECFNDTLARRYRPLVWPEERARIEATLLERPRAAAMNWYPGEPADTLEAETLLMRGA